MSEDDSDMHAHYMRALDEVWKLRSEAAHEAHVLEAVLAVKTLPKTAHDRLAVMRERMLAIACGVDHPGHLPSESRHRALGLAGASQTLTRSQWEASA